MELEHEYVMEVANGINGLLNLSAAVTMSWGITDRRATVYAGMPAMLFKVNGFVHQGDVVVALNQGQDLYECYLLEDNCRMKRCFREVYAEDLVGVLDRAVETGESTEDEYREQVTQWLEETSRQQCQGM